MGKMKGGSGDSSIDYVMSKINMISNIFVPLLIIVLFFVILVIHLIHMGNFVTSRWNKYTSSIKTDSPYNESLNITHCNINNSGDIVYNDMVLSLFAIFSILLVLFWYNYIVGLFSRTSIKNEIKIVGYNKYYNEGITNKAEYGIINMLSIYILITFLYYGYMVYDSYMGSNYNEIEIYKNIKSIDEIIENNMICDLYNKITNEGTKGTSLNEVLKKFFSENLGIVGDKSQHDSIEKRLKVVITCVLATDISFAKINQENNICKDNTYNLKCIYRRLYNIKNNKILPDYNDINLINVLANPTYLLKPGASSSSETITESLNVNENELKAAYEKIQNNITNYSREINKNHGNNLFYYKIGLIFATISSLLFSVIAIVYFGLFEFMKLNKAINNGVYFGIENFINNHFKLIGAYVTALLVVLVAFIINF
jgi:hypothetical protein